MKNPFGKTIAALFLIIGSGLLVFDGNSAPESQSPSVNSESGLNEIQIPKPIKKEVDPCLSAQQILLLSRLEGITPLCEELQNTGAPVGREVDSDFIWVISHPSTDYYYILAAHIPDDGSPLITGWKGAGLSGAVLQFCSDEFAASSALPDP